MMLAIRLASCVRNEIMGSGLFYWWYEGSSLSMAGTIVASRLKSPLTRAAESRESRVRALCVWRAVRRG